MLNNDNVSHLISSFINPSQYRLIWEEALEIHPHVTKCPFLLRLPYPISSSVPTIQFILVAEIKWQVAVKVQQTQCQQSMQYSGTRTPNLLSIS